MKSLGVWTSELSIRPISPPSFYSSTILRGERSDRSISESTYSFFKGQDTSVRLLYFSRGMEPSSVDRFVRERKYLRSEYVMKSQLWVLVHLSLYIQLHQHWVNLLSQCEHEYSHAFFSWSHYDIVVSLERLQWKWASGDKIEDGKTKTNGIE